MYSSSHSALALPDPPPRSLLPDPPPRSLLPNPPPRSLIPLAPFYLSSWSVSVYTLRNQRQENTTSVPFLRADPATRGGYDLSQDVCPRPRVAMTDHRVSILSDVRAKGINS
eukprot:966956-Rhodomonas_salina.1